MTGLILLASYPKSGNTWLRAMLESLRQGGRPVVLDELAESISHVARREWFDTLMGVESSALTMAEIARARPCLHRRLARDGGGRRLFKVHDACLPFEPGLAPPFPPDAVAAVLYVTRDPRDVAVSLAHHIARPVDEAITRMADPRRVSSATGPRLMPQLPQFLSSWSAHVESWLDAADLNVHAIRYEDMLADPETTFAAAARFIGLETGPEALAGALAATRFDVLRAQEEENGFNERPAEMERFFRQGTADGGRGSLTAAQAGRIVRDHGRVMRRLGYPP